MRELNPEMLREFGLTIRKSGREFGAYLCETDRGLYLVKSVDNSEREMRWAHLVKTHLREQGMWEIDEYVMHEDGQPWAEINRETITVRRWIRGSETDLGRSEDRRRLAEALARLHLSCHGLVLPEDMEVAERYSELPGRMERQMRRIRSMGKNIRRRGRLEEFDLLFLKTLRMYEEEGKEAIWGLGQGCMEQTAQWARAEKMFCHGCFSNHSVLFGKDEELIHDFEGAQLAPPVLDLARLMEKTLRKNGWNADCAVELAQAYESVRELRECEKKVLYYYLQYPRRAWELAGDGYERRSAWVPALYRNKLEQWIETASDREECLKVLKSRFICE